MDESDIVRLVEPTRKLPQRVQIKVAFAMWIVDHLDISYDIKYARNADRVVTDGHYIGISENVVEHGGWGIWIYELFHEIIRAASAVAEIDPPAQVQEIDDEDVNKN